MKINNKVKEFLPALVSTLAVIATGVGMILLYNTTKYLPLYMLGLILLLPSGINITLLIFQFPRGKKRKIKAEFTSMFEGEAPFEEVPAKKRNKPAFIEKFKKIRTTRSPKTADISKLEKFIFTLSILIAIAVFGTVEYFFFVSLKGATSLYTLGYPLTVGLLTLFVLFIILDKWCLHTESEDSFITAFAFNIRSALAVGRLALIFIVPSMFIKLLGFYDLQNYLVILLAVIFYWSTLVLVLSYIARAIRHELDKAPDIRIPTPFSGGSGKDMGIISYLEENTGITMRGLWSVQLVKKLILPSIVTVALIFWIATGIVEVGSGQLGAHYRLGTLRDEPLKPGLHLTLPWPFDRTVIYNTDAVSSMTIGYRSDTSGDNIWTEAHGSEEYELLLGGGEELVSINLCIEYKIGDLNAYLKNCANPEAILEANAYELVADRILVTDLFTLLSADREAFAEDFAADLADKVKDHGTGIDIVSVVLESIHPPLGIADIYQRLVSAEIEATTLIMNAEAYAAVLLLEAQTTHDTTVYASRANSFTSIAEAEASVAEFMASVSADKAYSDAYRYQKYLNALSSAYGNANLIIVDSTVDSSRLYFGSINALN